MSTAFQAMYLVLAHTSVRHRGLIQLRIGNFWSSGLVSKQQMTTSKKHKSETVLGKLQITRFIVNGSRLKIGPQKLTEKKLQLRCSHASIAKVMRMGQWTPWQ